jgi:glutathione S-transferase
MRIYDFVGAPNPKKVRIYLAEKGLEIERVPVDVIQGQNRGSEFREKNPMAGLPVLELDDGRCFSESLAIIEYLEELHPDPPMIGATAEERLHVRMVERICEISIMVPLAQWIWNTNPFFAQRIRQSADAAQFGLERFHKNLHKLDGYVGDAPFVAGQRPSIADCTLYASLWFGHAMRMPIDLSEAPNVARWNEAFRQRPSAKA